jgi:hypothetical protein
MVCCAQPDTNLQCPITQPSVCGFATATDACGEANVTFTDFPIPGGCPNRLNVIRQWTATGAQTLLSY